MARGASTVDLYRRGEPHPPDELRRLRAGPAAQQPRWDDDVALAAAGADLANSPGLVDHEEVGRLALLLAEVARGAVLVVQAGDCAEDPADHAPASVRRKAALIDELADAMTAATGTPTLRVGRIGGQYAKPRSASFERHGDRLLPVFRGHLVNGPEPDPAARAHDPRRLVAGYRAARAVCATLRALPGTDLTRTWTSHEALVLDYELPLLRRDGAGRTVLSSTHWPWIGDRTRQPDGAHVRLLAAVDNPVACKVGPTTTPKALLELCARLDPQRRPGRLTLVSRQGADLVDRALPPLVAAARRAGHPVVWLCDPLHGNTVTTSGGVKTRLVPDVVREVRGFLRAVADAGSVAGGLHLEATPEDVCECLAAAGEPAAERYTTLCDPRLNREQALAVVEAWCDEPGAGVRRVGR